MISFKGHLLFGKLFKVVMSPLGVVVNTEYRVMSDPPRVDILIIKKNRARWTTSQLMLVPDGIRESQAKYIILEFKYSQSLSEKSFQQALGYDYFFGEHHSLKREDLQTFIISSKTPRKQLLIDYGYFKSNVDGVYKSKIRAFRNFPLIVLNEIPDKYHNALIKSFASRRHERAKAEKMLQDKHFIDVIPVSIITLIKDIFQFIFQKPEKGITMKMNPQKAAEIGRFVDVFVNTNLSLKEILSQYKTKEVISQFKPKEVISQFKPEEVISQFKPEDILTSLDKKTLKKLKQQLDNIDL